MSDVTNILHKIESGDPSAAEQLLPLVYDELRKLAAAKLVQEKPGQTLQATALVHEAYLRLVAEPAVRNQKSGVNTDDEQPDLIPGPFLNPAFNGRDHFFAAAAEAMRRILVETARRKKRVKHGGEYQRLDIDPAELLTADLSGNLLALDEALDRLAASDSQAAQLVKLRYFAGLTIPQVAEVLGVSPRTADSLWSFARAWLRREIEGPP